MSGAEAAAKMRIPEGFKASVFATEPAVQNPIAMAWDRKGRMWVAENYTYAERSMRFDLSLRDRVLIFEDKVGDGKNVTRKVFTDKVQMLTSVEVGHGGVWLLCPPQLLFIPDKNGNDTPDGSPEVVLDGFTVAHDNYHNFANGLRWGPDGWLYGRVGASCPGNVGIPGTPDNKRIPVTGGLWRYNIKTKVFEMLCHGTTNNWGHDWDQYGEGFFINTVNGHLWHLIPGSHLVRPHTIDPNPFAYIAIDMHADHWHFDTGKGWQNSRDGKADALGGGHAHVGMMIYQGDQWPAYYHNKLFTLNYHGRRANVERLEREGSGYMGRAEPDVFFSEDPWFRGMEITYGPEGSGYILDWSDSGECHNSMGVNRHSGRIFKLDYGTPKQPDLTVLEHPASFDVKHWLELHRHPNEWFMRQARLELAEVKEAGKVPNGLADGLWNLVHNDKNTEVRLRALWSLNALEEAKPEYLKILLEDQDEHLRVWAIRLMTDNWPLDSVMGPKSAQYPLDSIREWLPALLAHAKDDKSGLVRLALATVIQRLPVSERSQLAINLMQHEEDAHDHNLPAMVWYGLIPLGNSDPDALVKVALASQWPDTLRWATRRLASDWDKSKALNSLIVQMEQAKGNHHDTLIVSMLQGMTDAFRGQRKVNKPEAWSQFISKIVSHAETPTNSLIRDLSLTFGDGRALDEVKQVALDTKADLAVRESAVKTLIESHAPDLKEICLKLLDERFINKTAVRGLALFDDPALGQKLAKSYDRFHPSERAPVIETLVSRPAFAHALLDEMAAGHIPRVDLNVFEVRQIRAFNDVALTKQLTEVWGEVRETADDKKQLIAKLKTQLTPEVIKKADLSQGRLVFASVCAACHRLYGEGAVLGPDLTGSGRANLDYLLDNIADPSAVVNADFRMSVVTLKDGRVLTGMTGASTDKVLVLRLVGQEMSIDRGDIKSIEASAISMMPEGLLQTMTEEQVRNLLAYLMHPVQVPLP